MKSVLKTALVALMAGAASSAVCGWTLVESVVCASIGELTRACILVPKFANIQSLSSGLGAH